MLFKKKWGTTGGHVITFLYIIYIFVTIAYESDNSVQLNDFMLSSNAPQEDTDLQVNDSGVGRLKKRVSESALLTDPPQVSEQLKRARLALKNSLRAAIRAQSNSQRQTMVDTPSTSKMLEGDNSVMFSPPSIAKHSFLEESTSLHSLMSADNSSENNKTFEEIDIETDISKKAKVIGQSDEPIVVKKSAMGSIKFDQEPDQIIEERPSNLNWTDINWQTIACGRTPDQLEMTYLAHQYLNDTANNNEKE